MFVGPSRQSGTASARQPVGAGSPQGSHGSSVEGDGFASAGNGEDSRGKFVCEGKNGGYVFYCLFFVAPSRQSGTTPQSSSSGSVHSQGSCGGSVRDVGAGGCVGDQEELEDDGDSRGKLKFSDFFVFVLAISSFL